MRRWLLLPGGLALGTGFQGFELLSLSVLIIGWGVVAAAVAVFCPRRWRWVLCLACLSGLWGSFWASWRAPAAAPSDISRLAPAPRLRFSGRVCSDLEALGADRWRVAVDQLQLADQTESQLTGKTLVYFKQTAAVTYRIGDRIQIKGRLGQVPAALNFGAFSYRDYLARQQVFSLVFADTVSLQQAATGSMQPERLLQGLRLDLVRRLEAHLPLGSARILASLIVGEKAAPVPEEIKAVFQAVGLQHVLAVSGFQVQLVVLSLLGLCLALRLPRSLCFGLALLGLWGFVGLTGGPPSVLRAACVASLGLLGFLRFRQADPLWALALGGSALLLWQPALVQDIGFQFSMLATAGLLLSTRRLLGYLGFLPLPLAGLCAPVLAAQIWVLPAQLLHFGSLSWLFLPANLLAGLITTALTWLALAGMLCGYLSSTLQGWVLLPAHALVTLLLQMLEALLQLPSPLWQFRPLPLGAVVLAYALLGFWIAGHGPAVGLSRTRRQRLLLAMLLALPLVLAGRSWSESLRCPVRVTYLAVGQGDSTLIEAAGQVILIDAGPRWPSETHPSGFQDAGERHILPYLQQRGIRKIDLAILSHPHLDHYGGFFSLAAQLPIAEFMTVASEDSASEKRPDSGGTYPALLKHLKAKGTRLTHVPHGGWRELASGLRLVFWQPLAETQTGHTHAGEDAEAAEYASLNNRSMVVQLRHRDLAFLFSGDLESAGEQHLLATPGFQARHQIVKVPHHGSKTSSTQAFLAAVQPREAIVSVGERNRFQHPSADVLARYQAQGSRVWRTDTDGAVCICSQGQGYTVQTARSARL
ncbi:MAG: DNA internalization-related competence protein ComEC/Rec2 [Candidatus Sericytochromatia bacterium]|nr:DNA internalization-related competence protein ComEC/Rec2 [Candidatus Sericytochromatia bacterium]